VVITEALSARLFNLVEYHVLQMNRVKVSDFALINEKYYQAVRMPNQPPNARNQGLHAIMASHCTTPAELGRTLYCLSSK